MFILHFGNTYFTLFLTFINFEDICFVLHSGHLHITFNCGDLCVYELTS